MQGKTFALYYNGSKLLGFNAAVLRYLAAHAWPMCHPTVLVHWQFLVPCYKLIYSRLQVLHPQLRVRRAPKHITTQQRHCKYTDISALL